MFTPMMMKPWRIWGHGVLRFKRKNAIEADPVMAVIFRRRRFYDSMRGIGASMAWQAGVIVGRGRRRPRQVGIDVLECFVVGWRRPLPSPAEGGAQEGEESGGAPEGSGWTVDGAELGQGGSDGPLDEDASEATET